MLPPMRRTTPWSTSSPEPPGWEPSWLPATPEEIQQLGTSGALTVLHHYALTAVTKNCLTWRDALLRVVEEEGRARRSAPECSPRRPPWSDPVMTPPPS